MVRKFVASLGVALAAVVLWGGTLAWASPVTQEVDPADANAGPTVTVAHFAPFASETISTSVTVRINGSDVITGFTYPQVVRNAALSSGSTLIEILPTGTNTVAISATVTLTDDTDYTVSAIGDGTNQGLELFAQVDDNSAPAAGNAKLRITHLAPFANTLDGTRVDICTEAGDVVAGLTNVPYKASSGYLELPAGDYDLKVTAAGSNCGTTLIDVPSVRLADGSITEVAAIGDGVNATPTVAATTDLTLTPAPATVTVAHFAPFAATLAREVNSTSVTVRIDGSDVITGFTYPNVVKNAVVPSGERLIEILPTGSSTVAISATVTLSPSVDYTVSAIGDGTNQGLELFAQVDDNSTPAAGNAKLRITHLAPFANTLDGTRVDICTEAGDVVAGLTNVPYKASSGYLELPAGDYDLKVTAAGSNCGTTLIDVPSVRLADGSITEVAAIGDGVNATPTVAATTDLTLTPAPATVTVAHFAPFAATLAREVNSTSVTVRIDGSDVITGFTYPNVVKNAVVPSGERLIEILPTGSSTVAISATVTLSPSVDYTVSAIGDGTNQGLELFAQVDDNSAPAAGNAKLRITHLAPFANTLDGTRVDICTEAGDVVAGLTNVPYKASSGYLELPAGQYDLKVSAAGSNCGAALIDLPLIELTDGQILELTAIGDGANATPSVALTTGELVVITLVYLVSIFR